MLVQQRNRSMLSFSRIIPVTMGYFEATNKLLGDSVMNYLCVKAYHRTDITLFFSAIGTGHTNAFGDASHIKAPIS